jgi:hypothetical protein
VGAIRERGEAPAAEVLEAFELLNLAADRGRWLLAFARSS